MGARRLNVADEVLVGVDIGASSVKAGAFEPTGRQLSLALRPNAPTAQAGHPGWFIWDAEALHQAVEQVLSEATASLPDRSAIRSVAVSGFGADGAPFSGAGQAYPIISWHDSRAQGQLERLVAAVGEREIYATTGYHPYPINTLCRWLWLKEHEPSALAGATWLMVPDVVAFWLSGELRTDPTSASTTMSYDLASDKWSSRLLEVAEVDHELLAELAEPGTRLGALARAFGGLPAGTDVAVGGHDCEVGMFAATASLPEATFVDITGTWEMLIVPTATFAPTDQLFAHWIDWERHVIPGSYLCQSLMPAGSVLQWLRELAYGSWEAMVSDAASAEPGAGGVRVVPAFVAGMGPFAASGRGGSVEGLRTTTTRAQIARAAFESLCFQLRDQLRVLEREMDRSCDTLRVLGGAQRNEFWLQLKADVTGVPVEMVQTEELTLLGAALLGGVGAGVFGSLEQAQGAVAHKTRVFEPRAGVHERYQQM